MNKYPRNEPKGDAKIILADELELDSGKKLEYRIVEDENRKNFLGITVKGKDRFTYLPEEIMKGLDIYLETEIHSLLLRDNIQPVDGADGTR